MSIDSMAKATERWLAPNAWRREAVEALCVSTGRRPSQIEPAIDAAFSELTRPKLLEFARAQGLAESGKLSSGLTVVHVAPANVFTAWLHGAVISLLMGFDVVIKPSSAEPVFPELWRQSLHAMDPDLAGRIRIEPWSRSLAEFADAVVAYGSDDSLKTIRKELRASCRWIGYGDQASVAVAFAESGADIELWEKQLASDLNSFGLDGCLSPKMILVESPAVTPWRKVLESISIRPELREFSDFDACLHQLRVFSGRLSCVGFACPLPLPDSQRAQLLSMGVTRICALGEMQKPPLDWRNGGLSLVEQLSRRLTSPSL